MCGFVNVWGPAFFGSAGGVVFVTLYIVYRFQEGGEETHFARWNGDVCIYFAVAVA